MNQFFYALTKRNWGWPYHVILADILVLIFLWILYHVFILPMPYLWHALLAGLAAMIVGYIYEVYQAKRYGPDAKEEFWEDVVGNAFGIMLGMIKYWLIM